MPEFCEFGLLVSTMPIPLTTIAVDQGLPRDGAEPETVGFFRQLPTFWKCQLLGWSVFVPYAFLMRVAFWQDYKVAVILTLCLDPLAFILSTGLRWLYLKIGLKRSEIRKTILVVTTGSFLAAMVEFMVSEALFSALSNRGASGASVRFAFFWMVFSSWSLGYLWLKTEIAARREQKRHRDLLNEAQRAELSMLRIQLNPHFLFNSLNNIAEEIADDPESATGMTRQLGKYLRYTLEHQDDLVVTVSEEIEAVRNYLAIEEKRFTNRLSTEIRVGPESGEISIPCFLIQPLVENAVKHGVMSCSPPWKLSVEVASDGPILKLRVSNTGVLLKDWQTRRRGTGIANLMKRLSLHYPGRHEFRIFQDGDKVVAELELDGPISGV